MGQLSDRFEVVCAVYFDPVSDFWSISVPSWLTGIGTLALAAVAGWSIRRDRIEKVALRNQASAERERADQIEARTAREAKENGRRAQASAVVAWSDYSDTTSDKLVDDGAFRMDGGLEVAVVQNGSAEPIFTVDVSWCYPNGTGVFETRQIPIVPPQGRKEYPRPESLVQQPLLPIEIVFRDARGIVWKRDRLGNLTELV